MSDIVTFLRARLDEDERIAREAGEDDGVISSWSVPCWVKQAREEGDDIGYDHYPCHCCRVEGNNITIYDEGGHDRSQALHIARWDPKRVLEEVEAKRQIIDLYESQLAKSAENYMEEDRAWTLRLPLTALAAPYAGHSDFNLAWATVVGS